MKRLIQILVLLAPFLLFIFFNACSSTNSEYPEFTFIKDPNLMEKFLAGYDLTLVEHRRTSNQQFKPSNSEINQQLVIFNNFPYQNNSLKCPLAGLELKNKLRNYPIFILDNDNKEVILAYLVKFSNSTGVLSANEQNIPVFLFEDFLQYLSC